MNNVITEPIETTSTINAPNTDDSSSTEAPNPRRLTRGEGPIAGVAGGFAEHYDLDPTLVRLGIVAVSVLTFPLGVIGYAAAWMIMPDADK